MSKLTRFYIVRHATTEMNEKKLIQGQSDSPLTKTGLKEAEGMASKFKNVKFDYVFASDLLRAKRTAEIIAMEHKLTVKTTQLLRERNYGHLEGKSRKNFREVDAILEKLSHQEKLTYKHADGFESDEEITNRFLTFLREIAVLYTGKTVLVVSHGAMIRTLLIKIGFATYDMMIHGAVRNGGFIKLDTDGVDFFVKEISGITLSN